MGQKQTSLRMENFRCCKALWLMAARLWHLQDCEEAAGWGCCQPSTLGGEE